LSFIGNSKSPNDREDFEFAGQLLEQLRDSGSFAALEFSRHIEAMKADIQTLSSDAHLSPGNVSETNIAL
jgi:proline utilization trans-activator